MISRIVNKLLETEKRITIPALGSFMRRNDGAIVFTDMLKDDDGVLSNHIASQMSITPNEALDDIAKFTEQVNRNLRERGIAELSDLGILTRNAQGKTTFVWKNTEGISTTNNAIEELPKRNTKENVSATTTSNIEIATTPISAPNKEVAPKSTNTTEVNVATSKKPATKVVKSTPVQPKRDWALISAIIAACIALACMAFGIFEGNVTSIILE